MMSSCAARRIRISALLLFLLPGFLLGACSSESVSEEEPIPEPLHFASIGYGQHGPLKDTLEIVIRDQETWAAWQDSLRPVAPFLSVDFSQAMVLLVALPQITSGYAVTFLSLDRMDSAIVAEYLVEIPAEDCLTAAAESVPFQAVLTHPTDSPIRFKRVEEEYRCTFGPRRRGSS